MIENGDAVRAAVECHRLGNAVGAGLGGGIADGVRPRPARRDAADVDDAAALLLRALCRRFR
jgi:hypothetical protein